MGAEVRMWVVASEAVCNRPTSVGSLSAHEFRHEFHPRADFPVICAVCGRHEHSLVHWPRVEQGPRPTW